MLAALLALAMAAQPEYALRGSQARSLASEILLVERAHGLPSGLLAAVVLAESGGRSVVVRGTGRGKRGCDVGLAQIHLPDCPLALVGIMLRRLNNLEAGAIILSWSMRWCQGRGCPCPGWRYNPGSRAWCPRVMEIWGRLRNFAKIL